MFSRARTFALALLTFSSLVAMAFAGLIVAFAGIATASPAQAFETGTAAWTLQPLSLREGPGNAYQHTGDVSGDLKIRVDRCSNRWCLIRGEGARGWVSIDHLSFGQHPLGPFEGPKLGYKRGGPGEVCLYEGANFTGAAVCAKSGFVVHDLKLYGTDNTISSVSVEGDVSVTLCRDRNFTSYCRLITSSESQLEGFLNNNLTSFRVY